MSNDLKAELLDILGDPLIAIEVNSLKRLRARLQSATITEPPPPDPCVVEGEGMRTWVTHQRKFLAVQTEADGESIYATRSQAAALIPALQAFVAEGGQ